MTSETTSTTEDDAVAISTNAFCCTSNAAIPAPFSYLLDQFPEDTTHIPFDAFRVSTPLITSFLVAALNNQVYRTKSTLPDLHRTSMQKFKAIIQTSEVTPTALPEVKNNKGPTEARYFVPFGDDKGEGYKEGGEESLFIKWKEITTWDALESIRPTALAVFFGDGEDWEELKGKECFWCDGHKVIWEVKCWVRISSLL